jgi:hypothetical protein
MGFSIRNYKRKEDEKPWDVHPAWRGIGCALVVLEPIMAWFGAIVFLQHNTFLPIPPVLAKLVMFNLTNYTLINRGIIWVNAMLGGKGITYATFFFWVTFVILGFGLLAILYGPLYRIAGLPRVGPFYVPPIKKGRQR